MRLGIFAKTFARPTIEGVFDAVARHGFDCVQFNFACVGLPTLPEQIEDALLDKIRREADARKISLAAVSGTFNLIHPDLQKRREGLRRLPVLAAACQRLGPSVITLCSGTRDPEDMWRRHPDNDTVEAWKELLASLEQGLGVAQGHGVTLAIEPEVANVIDSARRARRMLDEFKSPHLGIVIDPANLFHRSQLPRMREILDEAFDLLGADIVIAHAKDLGPGGEHTAAGKGVLDYDHYLKRLHETHFQGPLILHGLAESEVGGCAAFLRRKLPPPAGGATLKV